MPTHMAPAPSTISRTLLALCTAFLLLAVSLAASPTSAGDAFAAAASAPVVVGETAVVTNTDGDPIRVREGASVEFTPVTVAWEGESVAVLAGPRADNTGIRWFKVRARGGTGWIMSQYLAGTSKAQATYGSGSVAQVANTNGDMLRVRSAPNTDGKVLTRLNPGATVTIRSGPVTDKAGIAWYEITANGRTGWAMSQYLAVAPEAATATARKATAETDRVAPSATSNSATTASATPTANPRPAGATSTKAQYRQWLEEARAMHPYRESLDKMWSVMMCESGGNASASGGGGAWLGLFQYAPATWRGSWNPYRNNSIWDARSQIFATAKAWSIGMQHAWSCY